MTSPLDALRRTFPRIRLQISSNWKHRSHEDVRSGDSIARWAFGRGAYDSAALQELR